MKGEIGLVFRPYFLLYVFREVVVQNRWARKEPVPDSLRTTANFYEFPGHFRRYIRLPDTITEMLFNSFNEFKTHDGYS